jgi:hypothetical protein
MALLQKRGSGTWRCIPDFPEVNDASRQTDAERTIDFAMNAEHMKPPERGYLHMIRARHHIRPEQGQLLFFRTAETSLS